MLKLKFLRPQIAAFKVSAYMCMYFRALSLDFHFGTVDHFQSA